MNSCHYIVRNLSASSASSLCVILAKAGTQRRKNLTALRDLVFSKSLIFEGFQRRRGHGEDAEDAGD